MADITQITSEEAFEIIDTRKPLGLFCVIQECESATFYTAIDNSSGDAWVEDFRSLEACKNWLVDCDYSEESKEGKLDERLSKKQ